MVNCKDCEEPIKDNDEVVIYHKKCYDDMVEMLKEGCIRIGMRIHNKNEYFKSPGND